MQINNVDLNLFVVFDAIYVEGNISRAAKRLHLTQPAVSNALARLRRIYDDPLFVRSAGGVTPTILAQTMIADVRQALRLMQRSLDGNLAFDPITSDRHYRISMGEMEVATVLPALMVRLADVAPGVSVQCYQYNRRDLVGALGAGEIDLAIDIPQLSSTALRNQVLRHSEQVCVMRQQHPASAGRWNLQKLLQCEHVVVSSRLQGSSMFEIAMHRIGESITPKLRLQHYLAALAVVQATDLVLMAPKGVASAAAVTVKPLPFDQVTLGSSVYWHRAADEDPANRWLREQLIASAPPIVSGTR